MEDCGEIIGKRAEGRGKRKEGRGKRKEGRDESTTQLFNY